jgi:hypothetical protein
MGFSIGNYARIKKVEDKGNYADCQLVVSKKNKNTNQYETTFMGYVRFVGKAFNLKPQIDQRIKLVSCDTTNCYVKDNKLEFTKNPQYVCFDYELQGEATAQPKSVSIEDLPKATDIDLPF